MSYFSFEDYLKQLGLDPIQLRNMGFGPQQSLLNSYEFLSRQQQQQYQNTQTQQSRFELKAEGVIFKRIDNILDSNFTLYITIPESQTDIKLHSQLIFKQSRGLLDHDYMRMMLRALAVELKKCAPSIKEKENKYKKEKDLSVTVRQVKIIDVLPELDYESPC